MPAGFERRYGPGECQAGSAAGSAPPVRRCAASVVGISAWGRGAGCAVPGLAQLADLCDAHPAGRGFLLHRPAPESDPAGDEGVPRPGFQLWPYLVLFADLGADTARSAAPVDPGVVLRCIGAAVCGRPCNALLGRESAAYAADVAA